MKLLLRLLCLIVLLVLCSPVAADAPYRPSDIQAALNQHDFATADREIQAVLVAAPNSAVAHYWAAKVLIAEHHAGQALAEVQKAQTLPPPHFKDPAKLAEFNANLAKAAVDLQKTISDEETALAHPKTTTTVTKKLVAPPTAVHRTTLQPSYSSMQVLFVLGGGIIVLILLVILVRLLFGTKSEPVQVVHVTDRMASRPDREPIGGYGNRAAGVPDSPARYTPPVPPPRSYAAAPQMAAGMAAPASTGHSTGAVVGAGLGGLAAGMLLDEALHSHSGGFGGRAGGFGSQGLSEETDTTTTTTSFDDAPVQEDYRQDDQDLSSSATDDSFGSSDDGGGFSDDSGGGGSVDSF